MLPIPLVGQSTATVVGIDPGTVKLGFSAIEFDVVTFEVVKIESITLDGDKLPSSQWTGRLYGDRARRVESLEYHLLQRFEDVQPFGIASEAPFYNQKRPNAYAALMEVICGIRSAVRAYSVSRPLYLIDPPSVKKAVGAAGNADKLAVQAAIIKHPVISSKLTVPITTLDEHSLDATAVAYWLLQMYKRGAMQMSTAI